MSSSNNNVLKRSDESYHIKPFSMEAVEISTGDVQSAESSNDGSEADKKEDDAFQRGFTDGVQAGRLQILGDIEKELKLLRSIIEGIERTREEIYEKIEVDVVEMSLMVAKKIIYLVSEQERKIVVATAKEAIRKASDREMLKIKINPADHEVLNGNRTELMQCLDGIKGIIFEEDESIQPGGCLIETNQGDIDAKIDSQLRVIEGEMIRQRSEIRSKKLEIGRKR